jgi:hypothetical protein
MDKNDLMLHNHTNIQELIRFIDQKAGALLVIYGFIFTATIEFSKDLKLINPFALKGWDFIHSTLLFLSGIFLILLLIYQFYYILFKVIKPRSAQNYTQEEASVLYFDHISKRTKADYLIHYSGISDIDIKNEMLAQIYEISCIMSQKSERFNSILKYLFLTVLLLLIFIFLSKTV